MAALGVGLKVDAFVLMAVMALASAMMPFIGQNWGARRLDRAIEARRQAMRFAFCWGLANVAAFYAAAPWIARCFTSDPETIRVIVLYFRIVPLSFAFQGALRLSVSGLNAINRPLVSAAIQLLSSIVLFIPLVWLGGRLYGLAGIFAGIVVSHTATGLVSIVALRRAMRKIPDEQPMPKPAELVLEGQAEG
ncbi:MAG: multidrug efflux protein [candidate division BRC1 bacterium ADurb.BinA364]|nr:MAG: multidrug efflux protein [candidate division BRC1 bacterium ADurb.BinA364]